MVKPIKTLSDHPVFARTMIDNPDYMKCPSFMPEHSKPYFIPNSTLFICYLFVFIFYLVLSCPAKFILLNDFDDRHFISQTCIHCQFYCISLCVQLVTSADIGADLWKHFAGRTLIAYFTTKSYRKK